MRKNSVMAAKEEGKKLKKILEDLKSSDAKVVAKSIKALETHGDASAIKPLADLLLAGTTEKNTASIIELLSSLKDTSITADMMDVLDDDKYRPIRQVILTTIWNTKVDFSDYVDDFVLIATTGDFMEALECLTIIENLEGPFMEESILESQLHLKNYLESSAPKDAQKSHILSEIALKIKDFNESLMDL